MITLTSPIGKFIFGEDTSPSHAKLIRDTIVGQWLNPKIRTNHLHSVEDAMMFMRQHPSHTIANIWFDLILSNKIEDEENDDDRFYKLQLNAEEIALGKRILNQLNEFGGVGRIPVPEKV